MWTRCYRFGLAIFVHAHLHWVSICLQWVSMGLQWVTMGLHGSPMGLYESPVGLHGSPMGFYGSLWVSRRSPWVFSHSPWVSKGLQWVSMHLHGSPVGLHGSPMGFHGSPVGLHGSLMGLQWVSNGSPWVSMHLHGSPMGLRAKTLRTSSVTSNKSRHLSHRDHLLCCENVKLLHIFNRLRFLCDFVRQLAVVWDSHPPRPAWAGSQGGNSFRKERKERRDLRLVLNTAMSAWLCILMEVTNPQHSQEWEKRLCL